jgi:hypothetical protein
VKGPLRQIVDREQVFRSTHDYPDGWIKETLSCGHVHLMRISPHSPAVIEGNDGQKRIVREQVNSRRCVECLYGMRLKGKSRYA